MLKLIAISVFSILIGTLEAEAAILDKIKGLISKQYKECQETCQKKICTGGNLEDQQACWKQRDKCQKSFFEITTCKETESTANDRSNTRRLEILEKIYKEIPDVRYYFDEAQTSKDQMKLKDLSENERDELQTNLTKGIDIILKYCIGSISEIEKIKKLNLPPEEAKTAIHQLNQMIQSITNVKKNITDNTLYNQEIFKHTGKDMLGDPVEKTSPFTKYILKSEVIAPALLNFKNIVQQGVTLKWKLQNPPSPTTCQDYCGSDTKDQKYQECLKAPKTIEYCGKGLPKCSHDECKKYSQYTKCLKDISREKYCAEHCNMCNSAAFQLKKYQHKKTQKKLEIQAQSQTPENTSDKVPASVAPTSPWTKATPKPTEDERSPFGSKAKKKTGTMESATQLPEKRRPNSALEKSSRSPIVPPTLPPRPPRPQQLPSPNKFPQNPPPPPRPGRSPNIYNDPIK